MSVKAVFALGVLVSALQVSAAETLPGAVSGELKKWHKVTVSFVGPEMSEQAVPNPFLDYRLNVTFSQGGNRYIVPGYYAADGNASETSATRGPIWRVHFAPDSEGVWAYETSFRRGPGIALSMDPAAGDPAVFDGASGSFVVGPSDKAGRDHRGKGMLRYVGKHYLQFSETGEFFLKGGADSPENFLGYFEFDGTYDAGRLDRKGEARGDEFIHTYAPHAGDWRPGDPTWKDGKGKNIIGALNYLSSKGMNSVYFLTMNLMGDGKDVWPWTSEAERYRFDCSKLDQWEIVFSHMDRMGILLHVLTQETENDQMLNGGALGPERQLYYRELIARFAHHPAIVWNLGEENTNTDLERKQFAGYFHAIDPYDHPVTVHTYPGRYELVYGPLLGYPYLEGPSLQIPPAYAHAEVKKWIDRSDMAGRPWVVCLDEINPSTAGVKPDADDYAHDDVRRQALWGSLMAGAAGCEWYFGYEYAHNDLNCEDWRSRDHMWDLTRYALEFFVQYLPFSTMRHNDGLVSKPGAYCFAEPGLVYAVYLPKGGATRLDLGGSRDTFSVEWYNPRAGGPLQTGSVTSITGPGVQRIGKPPNERGKDWVALVRRVT